MVRAPWLALWMCLAAACCAAPDSVYSNIKYKFSLSPPAGWVARDHPEAIAVFIEQGAEPGPPPSRTESNREFIARVSRKLSAPPTTAAGFRANLTIAAAKVLAGTTVEKYARESRRRFEGLKTYRMLGEKPVKADGKPAVLRAMKVDLAEGDSIRMRELIVIRGEDALTFTMAAVPETFARHSAEFDRTMSTLKWTQ